MTYIPNSIFIFQTIFKGQISGIWGLQLLYEYQRGNLGRTAIFPAGLIH